jgi:hypothetical protein
VFYSISYRTGEERAAFLRHGIGAKRVNLVIDPQVEMSLPQGFRDANSKGELVYLLENKEYISVLLQRIPDEPDLPRGYVFQIPKENVLLTRVKIDVIRRLKP